MRSVSNPELDLPVDSLHDVSSDAPDGPATFQVEDHLARNEVAADQNSADDAVEACDDLVDATYADSSGESSHAQVLDDTVNATLIEALLFSTHHPLTAGRLAELVDVKSTRPIRRAIKALNDRYESARGSFRIEQVAGGFQMLTLSEFGPLVKKLVQRDADAKVSPAAMETLAVIAYKQPILRADIEAIRGVACGETIRSLMEKRLVKIAGRAEVPGRPILYGTTKRFLEIFGLNALSDLPKHDSRDAKPTLPTAIVSVSIDPE